MQEQARPTVVVIGASRGIGLALAQQLAARGDRVIATCRSSSPGLRALAIKVAIEVIEGVDIASADSVAGFVRHLGQRWIDVLAILAEIQQHVDLANLDFERVREQLEVNALGPLRVAHALLRNLRRRSKLFFLTSQLGSIGGNSSGGNYGYRMSKAALNMAGRCLARDLQECSIAVGLLHSGLVRTTTNGHTKATPRHAAGLLIKRMDEFSMATSGEFVHANGERIPW